MVDLSHCGKETVYRAMLRHEKRGYVCRLVGAWTLDDAGRERVAKLTTSEIHVRQYAIAQDCGRMDGETDSPNYRLYSIPCNCKKCKDAYWFAYNHQAKEAK
jgi:hypothetical protein